MPVRLDETQWATLVAAHGHKHGQANDKHGKPWSGPSAKSNEVVYLLALEGDEPDPTWRWWERALDGVVQTMQPAPAMTHVELIVPPAASNNDVNFATYLGKSANWGFGFGDSVDFYLNPDKNGPSWRAVPVMAHGAIARLRDECDGHVGTPYGNVYRLFNYPFSVPPLRSLAWTLDDALLANAHCATLTARCLRRALPELQLSQSSAWYGPSTLFLELTRRARMLSYRDRLAEMATVKALPEQEEASASAETLLRGSDDTVRSLSGTAAQAGIDLLCKRCVDASTDVDTTMERLAQKQLARALLRETLIARPHRLGVQTAPTATGAAPGHAWGEDESVGSSGMFRNS